MRKFTCDVLRYPVCSIAIYNDSIIEIYEHPNQKKYPGQKIYAISYNEYIYLIPFIETEKEFFLKTINHKQH